MLPPARIVRAASIDFCRWQHKPTPIHLHEEYREDIPPPATPAQGRMNTTACISAIALLGMIGMVTAYEELETFFPTENDSEDVSADKRYYLSPSCRRCMHNRNDYAACANCYSRTGPIPYYGTAKRSFEDLSSFLPVPYDRTRSKRGSFLACKCCLSLHRSNCCYRCGYFGPEKRSEYQPSFTDLYSAADCSCCNAGAFDFGCCLRCTRKRK